MTYINDTGLPSVTDILSAEGYTSHMQRNDLAMKRGTYVHDACDLYDKGKLDEDRLSGMLKPYVEGYKLFLKESNFDVVMSELRLCHNTLRYTGKFDRIGAFKFQTGYALIDIKTGAGIDKQYTGTQLAGYAELIGNAFPEFQPMRKFALHLKKNGKYNLLDLTDITYAIKWTEALRGYYG